VDFFVDAGAVELSQETDEVVGAEILLLVDSAGEIFENVRSCAFLQLLLHFGQEEVEVLLDVDLGQFVGLGDAGGLGVVSEEVDESFELVEVFCAVIDEFALDDGFYFFEEGVDPASTH
jgi:hypothetical protein